MKRWEFIAGLGGAVAWPLLVRAQQRTKPIIGWLDNRPGGALPEFVEGFRRGLAEAGFSEGRDVTVEYHTADGHIERLPALAAGTRKADGDYRSRQPCCIGCQKRRRGRYQSFLQRPLIRSSLAWCRALAVRAAMSRASQTAKALGLTVPPNLLALADEVIE